MTLYYAPPVERTRLGLFTGALGISCLSIAAALLAAVLQWYALGAAVYLSLLGLAIWRPRYGLYAVVLGAIALEPQTNDPLTYVGWVFQVDVASWSPLSFVKFSLLELLLLVTATSLLIRHVVSRRGLVPAQLRGPLLVFMTLLFLGVVWGVGRSGPFNIAMWETRSLFEAGLIALLLPHLFTRREHLDRLINLIAAGTVIASIEIIWRRWVVIGSQDSQPLDLLFAHDTPIYMNFVVVLLLARLIWPATGRQRLMALAIPIILYAEMVTERRAGWVGLDVALIVLSVFMFRLRRRHFYLLVVPLALLYCGYLAAFWNAEGAIAQPARAVRSINDPNTRDNASNWYRAAETANIRLNIKSKPLTGLGFGQPYTFYIPLPDLSFWVFWHYISHNAVLWLWMKAGPAAFIAFLALLGAGIVRGVQMLKRSTGRRSAPYLVAMVCALLIIPTFAWVDISLTNIRICALLGIMLGGLGCWERWAAGAEENHH